MIFYKLISYFNIDSKEFTFQFQSHPNYPSALAFSDTLNFMGIKNDAYNLEKEYWNELPAEFITIYKDQFSLVKKENSNYRIYSEVEQSVSEEELFKHSQNLVMLFEKSENKQPSKTNAINYGIFILVLLGIYVVFNFFLNGWVGFAFNMVSLIGIYISYEIFSEKFGKTSVALNTICGNTAKSSESNCTKIINSDLINIFGLKLSDFSLIYFVGIAIVGLLLPTTSLLLQITSVLSIAVIFYSFYIQIFVEKTTCKICLIIITILIIQIILSRFFIVASISFLPILASVLIFSTILFTTIYLNDLLKKNEDLEKSNLKNLKFKRNYEIFKRELISKDKIQFKNNSDGFFFGNPNANLHISMVSNPYCGFCKDAHVILQKLLANYPEDISAQIRFNYFPEKETGIAQKLMQTLYSICINKGTKEFLNALHFWFENRNEDLFFKNYKNSEIINNKEIEISALENKEYNLNFTPNIILNGFQFPDKYDREDIFYFIDELLDDEDFINEN